MGDAKRRGTEAERIQQALTDKNAGMLELSVAITGTELNMDDIQILDPKPFGKITNWMMRGMAEAMKTKRLDLEVFTSKGWKQEDGSLIVRLLHKTAINDEFRVSKEQWQVATPGALSRAEKDLTSPEGAELLKALGEIAKGLEAQAAVEPPAPTPQDVDELLDMVFVVIGREPAGVHFLSSMAVDNPYLTNAADAWIANGAQFFTIPLDRKDGLSVPQIGMPVDVDALFGVIQKQASITNDMGRAGLSIVGVDRETQKSAYDLWATKGGNVMLRK